MLEVTGFIKDKYPSLPHKKLLSNTTYEDGFYFKVFVDYDDIVTEQWQLKLLIRL